MVVAGAGAAAGARVADAAADHPAGHPADHDTPAPGPALVHLSLQSHTPPHDHAPEATRVAPQAGGKHQNLRSPHPSPGRDPGLLYRANPDPDHDRISDIDFLL